MIGVRRLFDGGVVKQKRVSACLSWTVLYLRFNDIPQSFKCTDKHCYNQGKYIFRLAETRLLLYSLFEYIIRINTASRVPGRGGGGGVFPYISHMRYVRPQWVWFLNRFGLK